MLQRVHRKGNPSTLLVGMYVGTITVENSMEVPSKLNTELPYDPATPLLAIYPEKTIIWKDTCTPLFIASLFTIAKTWKQCKRPSTEEWIKKEWYIYTMEYYLAIKKNETMPFAATLMDLETDKDKGHMISLSEVCQTKTNVIWYH